ncbi:hypothetical protein L345_06725, partial [Ophiophagus hannah]
MLGRQSEWAFGLWKRQTTSLSPKTLDSVLRSAQMPPANTGILLLPMGIFNTGIFGSEGGREEGKEVGGRKGGIEEGRKRKNRMEGEGRRKKK